MTEIQTTPLPMPEPGTYWWHRKGGLYLVLGRVRIEATEEIAVRYVPVSPDGAVAGEEWVRALTDWHAAVPGHGPRFQPAPRPAAFAQSGAAAIG